MPNRVDTSGTINLSSDSREVEALLDRLNPILEKSTLDEMSAFHLSCAVVEVVNNCIQHAYANEAGEPIRIDYRVDPAGVRIDICDRGPEFTGVQQTAPSDPMSVSGRGFEIIRAWVNDLQFERRHGWNICRLQQRAQPGA